MKFSGRVMLVVLVVAAAMALWLARQARIQLSERNRALRAEVEQLARTSAPRLPLSPLKLQGQAASALPAKHWQELLRLRGELGVLRQQKVEAVRLRADNARMRSNWVNQIAGGKKLSLAQVEPYLRAKSRSADSLIVASQLTGNMALLREAQTTYPSDPRVALTAYFAFRDSASPEERRQQLEVFKQGAPDNALADFLSAQAYFKSGQPEAAVAELVAASGKPNFQDYYAEAVGGAQEAYQAAGMSPLEAAMVAGGQPLPQLAELKGLGRSLGELAQRYRHGGDEASARAAVQMGVALGRQLGEPVPLGTVIGQFVGIAIEREILGTLDPTIPYDTGGRSIQDRLNELQQEREAMKALLQHGERLLQALPDSERMAYFEQVRASGEREAMRWLVDRAGSH